MTKTERQAREALILKLIEGYPSLAGRATRGLIDAYVDATAGCSLDALQGACQRYARGEVPGQAAAYAPTAPELAAQARVFDLPTPEPPRARPEIVAYPLGGRPPEGYEELGPVVIEIRGRNVDMRKFSLRQKLEALLNDRLPDSPRIEALSPRLRKMT